MVYSLCKKKPIILTFIILSISNLSVCLAHTSLKSASQITDFFVESKEEYLQFTIVADGIIGHYQTFILIDPTRIVIDVFNVNLAKPSKLIKVQSEIIEKIRIGGHPDKIRFVLDSPLKEAPSFSVNLDKNKLSVIIERIAHKEEIKELEDIPPPEIKKKETKKKWLRKFVPDRVQFRLWLRGARDINRDDKIESQNLFRNRTYMEFRWSNFFGLRAFASGRVDYLLFGNGHRFDETFIEPLETYLELIRKSFDLRVGNLILRWGKTDEISPVDNINPQDMRELFTLHLEDRKLPIPMLRARYYLSSYTLEGIFIPHFKPHRLNYFDTDWAFFRHLKGLIRSMDIPPQLKDYVTCMSVKEERPASNFKNSEVGIRLLGTIRNFDYGLSAFYTRNRTPFIESFPVKNLRITSYTEANQILKQLDYLIFAPEDIIVKFDRQSIFGIEFETTLRKFGLRGEMAYFTNQSFLENDLTSTGKPVIHWVLGIDRLFPYDFYANLQVSQRIIRDYNPSILFFKRVDTAGFLRLSKGFFRDKFILRLDAYHSFCDDSSYFSPEFGYSVSGNLSLSLGLNFIEGPSDTFLGQYDDNDQVYLSILFQY